MLKPSDDAEVPNKNSTEYAEIVYVSSPTGEQVQQKLKQDE